MVNVCGAGRTHQTHEVQANLDMIDRSQMNPKVAEHIDSAQHAMQGRIDDLKQQIRETNDPAQKLALENEIMKLEEAFDKFKGDVYRLSGGVDISFGTVRGPFADQVNAPELRSVVAEFRNLIADSYQQFGTANMPPKNFCGNMAIHRPVTCGNSFPHIHRPRLVLADAIQRAIEVFTPRIRAMHAEAALKTEGTDKASGPEGTGKTEESSKSEGTGKTEESSKSEGTSQTEGASGTSESEGAGKSEGAEESDFNASEMLELYNKDPMAFYDQLSSMSTEDRNAAMMMIQNEMQQINQMFSMISNLAKSMHDTSKAMINNMRV